MPRIGTVSSGVNEANFVATITGGTGTTGNLPQITSTGQLEDSGYSVGSLTGGSGGGGLPDTSIYSNILYVDGGAAVGGDGSVSTPYQSLLAALTQTATLNDNVQIIVLSDASDFATPIVFDTLFPAGFTKSIYIKGVSLGNVSASSNAEALNAVSLPNIPQFTWSLQAIMSSIILENVRIANMPSGTGSNSSRITEFTLKNVICYGALSSTNPMHITRLVLDGFTFIDTNDAGLTYTFNSAPGASSVFAKNVVTNENMWFGSPAARLTGNVTVERYLSYNGSGNDSFTAFLNSGTVSFKDSTFTTVQIVGATATTYKNCDALTVSLAGTVTKYGSTPFVKFEAAASDPTTGDDIADGFAPTSMWHNTSSGEVRTCVDNSSGAAIWVLIGDSIP